MLVDNRLAEMSNVCLAPALIAPPLAASEAPNGTESLEEVFEWVLEGIRAVKRPRIVHRPSSSSAFERSDPPLYTAAEISVDSKGA